MLLGAYIDDPFVSPQDYIDKVISRKYEAVVFPLAYDAPRDTVAETVRLLSENNIVSAEIGAWSNIISPFDEERKKAIEFTENQLAHADETGTRLCVNISGAAGEVWCGGYAENYSEDTKALIIDTVRRIIDDVKPKRAKFALETMQWAYPDSADSYLEILKKTDRKEFAVHLDVVNLINSPRKYYFNSLLTKECFKKLGKYIVSVHLKDVYMPCDKLEITETAPGKGNFDFKTLFSCIENTDKNISAMIEHLSGEEYMKAFSYLDSLR